MQIRITRGDLGGSWAKFPTGINDAGRSGGYAFVGDFVDRGQLDVELGAVAVVGADVGSRKRPQKRLTLRIVLTAPDGSPVVYSGPTDKDGDLDFRDHVRRTLTQTPAERVAALLADRDLADQDRLAALQATRPLRAEHRERRAAASDARAAAESKVQEDHPHPGFGDGVSDDDRHAWVARRDAALAAARDAHPVPGELPVPADLGSSWYDVDAQIAKLERRAAVDAALRHTLELLQPSPAARRAELQEERERLIARLAEIDAELGTADPEALAAAGTASANAAIAGLVLIAGVTPALF